MNQEDFDDIANFFTQRAFARSSYPYEDICDNYYNFMKKLKSYKHKKKGIDYMKLATESIYKHLENGVNSCPNWDDDEFSDHFCFVDTCINYWKEQIASNK